jgi:hypothetical protein
MIKIHKSSRLSNGHYWLAKYEIYLENIQTVLSSGKDDETKLHLIQEELNYLEKEVDNANSYS